jgi:hypothetical protein
MNISDTSCAAAASKFFDQFSRLESVFSAALSALADDAGFVAAAERLLEFDSRLTLLKRLGFVRGIPSALKVELDEALSRAEKIFESRRDLNETILYGAASNDSESAAYAVRRHHRRANGRGTEDDAQSVPVATYRIHTVVQVNAYTAETLALQQMMREVAERLDAHRCSTRASCAEADGCIDRSSTVGR